MNKHLQAASTSCGCTISARNTKRAVTRADTTWLPPLDVEELTRMIAAKESKLTTYRQRCTSVWLLIVIDGFRISSMIETPETWPKIPSAFDRVLVLYDRRIVARVDAQ